MFDPTDENFDADIDLTPLIDVVFLLIIFFVLASTFNKPVLDLILPVAKSASSESSSQKREDLVVNINKTGKISCEDKIFTKENIGELITLKPDLRLNLFVDKQAPFESFIILIDAAKLAKRENIVITTEKHEKSL